ncbi:MAG TPA: molybdopterin molybdotransferase MoeA [Actinomycetota bacterium]|nr:molybdopterin molybdotransferase MoeA [Actinomycetota bacterium]
MRSLSEHLQLVLSRVRPLEPLALPLLDANGCVLAMDVIAPVDVPGYHSSAVVGYAARAREIAMASPQSVLAMRELPPGSQLAPGCVIPVGVGAPLPYGSDCVIPAEFTDNGVPVVRVGRAVSRAENVVLSGSQIRRGSKLLAVGQMLGSREIALLAAVGIGRIPAYPRPRIAVLTTGSELVDTSRVRAAQQLTQGKPDINGVSLACAVVEAGALSYRVGPVADDPVRLRKILDDQLGRADMVVTTGGIGSEPDDVLRPVLATMGTVDFAFVAIEPGRVQGTGSLGSSNVPLIALPGEPTAAFVGFELFVRPVVRRLMGQAEVFAPRREASLGEDLQCAPDVTTMVPVELDDDVATPVGAGAQALVRANALAVVTPPRVALQRGDPVTVMMLGRS